MCKYYVYKDEGLTADLYREPTEDLFWEDSELVKLKWLTIIIRGVWKMLPSHVIAELKIPRIVNANLPYDGTPLVIWSEPIVVLEMKDGTVFFVTHIPVPAECGTLLGKFEYRKKIHRFRKCV